ncbi:eukaryotic translation initiation factor 5B [Lates calcarifer]|uniref:Eukaryotic translation initiation factor 5B n=1 Tax=Lates calcarifer TaxID=8187 RepID=A0AAJ7PC51_LATCA|nr:eukaryotic translation initiation factor 5B [Lates calcarifer]
MGKKQKKSGEDSAKDDGIDIDALAAEIEGAGASKEPKGKKVKKKGGKKDDFDEDDILKELEELSLETQGGKGKKTDTTEEVEIVEPPKEKKKTRKGRKGAASPQDEEDDEGEGRLDAEKNGEQKDRKAPPAAPPSDSDDDSSSRSRLKAKGGKKGGKKPSISDEDEDEGVRKGGGGKEDESEDDEEFTSRRDQKKKSKGKPAKAESGEEEEQEEEAGGFKIKTAAQKKAEKKERDRKKKEEERMKQKKLKEKEKEGGAEAKKEPEKKTTATEATPPQVAPPAAAMEEQEGAEPAAEEEAEGDKKKKDKKKKKGEKEEKEKKKGPSKATVKAMQEALAKMKEEEERAKREEEERLRRLEELEKQRQEQERLEQERKEKKKQKEKERKERLKKEGKLLTKAQREARARAEATLKLLQAQGVEVPSKDSVPKKKPVYGDKRKKKPSAQTPEETSEVTSPTSETPEPVAMETEAKTPAAEPEVKPDAAVDDWEAIASDEEKELKKVHIEVKEENAAAPPQPTGSEEDEEDDDEEEDDDDDEEDEEEEEESEEEKEPTAAGQGKRKESEDESSESDDDDGRTKEERLYDRAKRRIEKRRVENMKNIDLDTLRAPVVCVLGHVDTGKTKILDKLRHTHVQDGEAGGITQQIGATNVPKETIEEQTKMVKNFDREIKIPGMLIIDTPGHESFSNLRNRGSSLCDIAILVVDIMHGLEPQTLESINLLKEKKCPFIVALNKIDRLYDWKKSPDTDIVTTLKKQKKNTKDEFDERAKAVIVEFAQQGLNAALFYENKDPRTFVSLVPTSAHSGDGMGNLIALLIELTQTMLARRLAHCDELRAQVMEVKALPGMGTTIDVILINGRLREGETIIVPGVEGPIVTQIRGLLLPPPLKELRVKNQYEKHKEVSTSQGVKILGKDLEKALAGLPLLVAHRDDEIPVLRDELVRELKQTLSSIKLEEKGVYVQASTLGSLEALLEFLRTSKVPYAGINIGPVHKKDVMKASTMLEHDPQYAVILAFDVKVERESQEMADSLGVRIFSAEIIYHLFDAFTKYREDYKKAKQDEFKHIAVFPVKLRVLPQFIFNSRDPIVMGVSVEAGVLRQGTPLCVPSKGFVDIGVVTSIEMNHKSVDSAKKGQEICVKIEPIPGESPKMYGRHFEATDIIVSKITRASIDALKNWFRDEMQKSDWQLIMELKKTFEII